MTRLVRYLAGFVICVSAASAGSVTFTCAPNVDATDAGTCAYLNTAIAGLYNSTFSNASANIFIEQGITSLATSETAESFVPYSVYLSALTNGSSGDGVDTAALAALNSLDSAVYGSDNVVITSALAGALGFTQVGGLTASGANCTIGAGVACYNGIIVVTTPGNLASQQPGKSLYYRQNGGSITPGAYDYYSLVERETDDILGATSCVATVGGVLSDYCDGGTGAAAGTGTPAAADLFRYYGPGNLALNNAYLGLGAAPAGAYFSYDGGVTNGAAGAVYNTVANSQNYTDFTATCTLVQTAAGCRGKSVDITTDGSAETDILDAVGYNLSPVPTPEPGTLALLGAGLVAAGVRRYLRRS